VCYSLEADLIAGLVVGAVGIDAVRHVDDRRNLALAAVPLVLAAHLLVEAVAWWSLEGSVSGGVLKGRYHRRLAISRFRCISSSLSVWCRFLSLMQ